MVSMYCITDLKRSGTLMHFHMGLDMAIFQHQSLFNVDLTLQQTHTNYLLPLPRLTLFKYCHSFMTNPYLSTDSLSRLVIIQVLSFFHDWPLFTYQLLFNTGHYSSTVIPSWLALIHIPALFQGWSIFTYWHSFTSLWSVVVWDAQCVQFVQIVLDHVCSETVCYLNR